jgi:hypothetical protein
MGHEKTVWYDLGPEVPAIPDGAFGLLFALAPRPGEPGRPLLHGAFSVPGRYELLYGSRLPGATEIVAIDRRTGRVFREVGENGHLSAPPWKTRTPDLSRKPLLAFSGNFSVDLVPHLGLPPATYSLFLWLDDLTSAVQDLDVGPPPGAPAPGGAIRFARGSAGVPGASAAIELVAEHGAVAGRVRCPGPVATDTPLTVLALCHATRAVGWRAEVVPRALGQAEWRFRAALSKVLPDERAPGPVSVLAFFDGSLSNALTISEKVAT